MSKHIWQTIKPFAFFITLGLFLLFTSRFLLLVWQIDRIDNASVFFIVLFNGMRIDLSSLAYLILIPALVHPFLSSSPFHKGWFTFLKIWFFVCTVFLLYFEFATPLFIDEFDLRPNRLFIEYLTYPEEVFKMLVNGHLLPIIITFTTLTLVSVGLWRFIFKAFFNSLSQQKTSFTKTNFTQALISFFVLIPLLFLSARGTLQHRPINPSLVYFSSDALVNSLTLNSAYSVAFAFKQLSNEKNAAKIYGKMSEDKVLDIVKESTGIDLSLFNHKDIPTLAMKIASYQGKKKNIVIILEESLGARFSQHLVGEKNLTPELDKLMMESWTFKQLYATGTRSVRGIEAVVTGFTPTPARSVVKLDKSQHNFFTLATLLQRHDYHTQFIYGGESHFDNMKSFFLGNGFTDIVDFADIKNPEFVGSWGASDEDLFNQANTELTQLQQTGKPFFSLIFTSSNHDPFEFPKGKIPPLAKDHPSLDKEGRRERAISYADYAVGKFIATAKKSNYWQNTIFLIVADHDARAYSTELVPVRAFHIPAIILGEDIKEKQDIRLVSQIDLAPTLLSLAGISDMNPMLGQDLTQETINQRAMMQFANNFAYMTPKKVAVLQPSKPINYYQYDFIEKKLKLSNKDKIFGEKALAHALFGSMAYSKGWFRLPE